MDREKLTIKKVARERIEILSILAYKVLYKDPLLAKKYIALIRKIGMKSSVRLPKNLKMFICKKCGDLLVPGLNCRVRLRPNCGTKIIITCLNCMEIKRYPVTKKIRSKKIE